MDTLAAIGSWNARNGRRPLIEVAREQADRLRATHAPVPPRNARAAQRAEHAATVAAKVARHGAPARKAPMASVQATPAPTMRELYAQADTLAAQVHAGRYALPRTTPTAAGNDITFFEVVEFKSGPRKGARRIFQIISNGRGFTQQALPPQHQIYALRHILADLPAAAGLFGRTIEICAFGPHPLTNARSRAAGYGETCAKHRGLPW